MARKRPAVVPNNKFIGKYANHVLEAEALEKQYKEDRATINQATVPFRNTRRSSLSWSQTGEEVEGWWLIPLLRAATAEKDTESYKQLVSLFLGQLGAEPPEGVLIPFRLNVGRPRENEMILGAWVANGSPALNSRTLDRLAKILYPDQFPKALSDGKLRKNLRDRVGNAIRRNEARGAATKPHLIS